MDAESWCLHEINPFPTPENLWKEMVGLADRDVGGIVSVSTFRSKICHESSEPQANDSNLLNLLQVSNQAGEEYIS